MAKDSSKAKGDGLMTREDLLAMRAGLSKDLGTEIYFGSDERLRLKKLPLGVSTLDAALNGGFAFDRMTLIVGEFSAGKTLIAMLAIKAAQAAGLLTVFIDIEKTWTTEWAEQLGIDSDLVVVMRPNSGEDAFNAAAKLVEGGVPVIVIDSLAAMVSEAELAPEADELMQKQFIGGTAKLIGRGLKMINNKNKGSLVICINQIREKPGIVYGSPETMPGGKAPGYYAWQLVRVRRGAFIEEDGKRVGYLLKIQLQKNKQGAPFTEAEVPFYYTGIIDEIAGLVEQGMECGAIIQKGANYTIAVPDPVTGEFVDTKFYGRRRLVEAVKEDEALQVLIRKHIGNVPEIDL